MKMKTSFTRSFLTWSILTLLGVFCSAPALALPNKVTGINVIDQKPIEQALNSNLTVVVFLSAKCPCSDSHIVELKALAKDFPTTSFIGIHSNFDEAADITKDYFQKAALPFPVLQDVKAAYANEFHASKTPHAFLIDAKGHVLYKGGVSDSHNFAKSKRHYLREALNDLKAGKTVATAEGRTLGCVITRENGNAW